MDEGMEAKFEPLEPDPSLKGSRVAILMGPCPEEPEIVVPLDFLKASGAQVDIIAPDWTPRDWLPAARFWTPTIKIPYQKKISDAVAADYQGIILVGGTWNPAVVRTDAKMLEFIREAARKSLPIFSICHGAQILISAGLISKGLKVTGSPDIRNDLRKFGAEVVEDQPVVIDTGTEISNWPNLGSSPASFTIVSSRDPNDLAHFCRAIAKHL
jgi:protease I